MIVMIVLIVMITMMIVIMSHPLSRKRWSSYRCNHQFTESMSMTIILGTHRHAMIGLNEAKSRLALRICGKLDHLAAWNNFFFRIYVFILFCFYLFILAVCNNFLFRIYLITLFCFYLFILAAWNIFFRIYLFKLFCFYFFILAACNNFFF